MNLKEFFLDKLNLYLEKKTKISDIQNLLKRITPYEVGKELIRLGEDSDGGYLIPNDLENINFCYSAGVGNVTKFEIDLEKKFNIKSIMLDSNNVPKDLLPKKSEFINKKLSLLNDDKNITINNFITSDQEIILKLDIEGDEYSSLISLDEKKLSNVRILVLEVHDLRNLRSKFFFKTFSDLIYRLSNYFYFCHLHPNNTSKIKKIGNLKIPDMLELTLINKSRVKKIPFKKSILPHKLDKKTDPSKKDIYLDLNF